MDCETAKDSLNYPADRKASELGEAVDALYHQYGKYDAIAKEVTVTPARLSQLHRVFLLPAGIRWQVDKGKIRIGHVHQVSRLQGDDQWLLAFSIVEAKMSVQDSKQVVDVVTRSERPLREVLQTLIGIRFDEVNPLLLPLPFEDRFRITRAAWTRKLEWADFSLRAIEEATSVDREQLANELQGLVDRLRTKSVDPIVKPDSPSMPRRDASADPSVPPPMPSHGLARPS